MHSFFDWLAMGGYAQYVWSAYGLAAAVLVFNVLALKKQKKLVRSKLQHWFKG